jgi:predicted RecA/RadA family phage recombinase
VPNKVVGLFRDIVDTPRISGTRRYLFADPNVVPTIEVVFLEGQSEPVLESQDGWRVDGVEWKVRYDYGIGAIDWRGAVNERGPVVTRRNSHIDSRRPRSPAHNDTRGHGEPLQHRRKWRAAMPSNFVSPGRNVTLTVPAAGVVNGSGYLVGAIFVIAQRTVAFTSGATFEGATTGVWDLAKVSAQAWIEGDKIFWDASASKATNVFGANARFIGIAVAAAANPSATGKVRLNGGYSPLFPEVAAAAASYTPTQAP